MNHKPHKYHKCKYKHQYKQVHPKVHRMPGDLGSLVHHQQRRMSTKQEIQDKEHETPLRWRLEEDGDENPVDRSQRTPRCFPLSMILLSLRFAPQICLLPQPWCPRKWWRRRSGQRPLIKCPRSPYKDESAAAHGWPHGRHTGREVAQKTGQETRKSATVFMLQCPLRQYPCYSTPHSELFTADLTAVRLPVTVSRLRKFFQTSRFWLLQCCYSAGPPLQRHFRRTFLLKSRRWAHLGIFAPEPQSIPIQTEKGIKSSIKRKKHAQVYV